MFGYFLEMPSFKFHFNSMTQLISNYRKYSSYILLKFTLVRVSELYELHLETGRVQTCINIILSSLYYDHNVCGSF